MERRRPSPRDPRVLSAPIRPVRGCPANHVGGSLRTRELYVVRTQNRLTQTSGRQARPVSPMLTLCSGAEQHRFPKGKAGCPRAHGSGCESQASGWCGDEQGRGGEGQEGEVLLPAQRALRRPRRSAQTCSLPSHPPYSHHLLPRLFPPLRGNINKINNEVMLFTKWADLSDCSLWVADTHSGRYSVTGTLRDGKGSVCH